MVYKGIKFSEDDILKILQTINLTNISNNTNEFKFSWYKDSNPSGACLFKKTLRYVYWSKNQSGDLIDLVMKKANIGFLEAKQLIESIVNKTFSDNRYIKENPYQEFLSTIKRSNNNPNTYNYSLYEQYPNCISKLFLDDGIGLLAHDVFDIRFDDESNRIIFPIRDMDGNLLGILGRYNKRNVDKRIPKYLPILNYERHYELFGIYENKDFLHDTIILVESEKSVMKAFSMGYRNVLALGGSYISPQKKKILLKLSPKSVILALDEGLLDDHIKDVAKSLISSNPFIKWHVGYIPSNNVDLGEKNCIFDESKEKCQNILKKVRWIS